MWTDDHAGAVVTSELFIECEAKGSEEIDGTLEVLDWQIQKDCIDHGMNIEAEDRGAVAFSISLERRARGNYFLFRAPQVARVDVPALGSQIMFPPYSQWTHLWMCPLRWRRIGDLNP